MRQLRYLPLAALFVSTLAQSANTSPQAVVPEAKSFDRHFLSKLHNSNRTEVELGKLTAERSNSDEIKEFGKKMIKDHSNADRKVLRTAKKEGFALQTPFVPSTPEEQAAVDQSKHELEKLASLRGSEFDVEFKKAMIDSHQKNIESLTEAMPKLKSKRTQELARTLLPIIKGHESHAEALPPIIDQS